MSLVCHCASEECRVLGCARVREIRRRHEESLIEEKRRPWRREPQDRNKGVLYHE